MTLKIRALDACIAASLVAATCTAAAAAPTPVAQYDFAGSLASSVAGASNLVAIDPLGHSGFAQDTVFGVAQTVWSFAGQALPEASQAGLVLSTAGLLADKHEYSLDIVFKFTEGDHTWRRIFDTSNRGGDVGFYVNDNNRLEVSPLGGGPTEFTNGVYHEVLLTHHVSTTTFYLDGTLQASWITNVVVEDTDTNQIDLFLDNVAGPGRGDYASGRVASVRLYDVALDAPPLLPVPEAPTWAMLPVGLAVLAGLKRRARRARSIA